jgi:hypothetical protein
VLIKEGGESGGGQGWRKRGGESGGGSSEAFQGRLRRENARRGNEVPMLLYVVVVVGVLPWLLFVVGGDPVAAVVVVVVVASLAVDDALDSFRCCCFCCCLSCALIQYRCEMGAIRLFSLWMLLRIGGCNGYDHNNG